MGAVSSKPPGNDHKLTQSLLNQPQTSEVKKSWFSAIFSSRSPLEKATSALNDFAKTLSNEEGGMTTFNEKNYSKANHSPKYGATAEQDHSSQNFKAGDGDEMTLSTANFTEPNSQVNSAKRTSLKTNLQNLATAIQNGTNQTQYCTNIKSNLTGLSINELTKLKKLLSECKTHYHPNQDATVNLRASDDAIEALPQQAQAAQPESINAKGSTPNENNLSQLITDTKDTIATKSINELSTTATTTSQFGKIKTILENVLTEGTLKKFVDLLGENKDILAKISAADIKTISNLANQLVITEGEVSETESTASNQTTHSQVTVTIDQLTYLLNKALYSVPDEGKRLVKSWQDILDLTPSMSIDDNHDSNSLLQTKVDQLFAKNIAKFIFLAKSLPNNHRAKLLQMLSKENIQENAKTLYDQDIGGFLFLCRSLQKAGLDSNTTTLLQGLEQGQLINFKDILNTVSSNNNPDANDPAAAAAKKAGLKERADSMLSLVDSVAPPQPAAPRK